MIEFRFKIKNPKTIKVLNAHAPNKKSWKIDSFTGEYWIKIATYENTQRFNDFTRMFLQIHEAEETLKIKDCSNLKTKTIFNDDRPTLF